MSSEALSKVRCKFVIQICGAEMTFEAAAGSTEDAFYLYCQLAKDIAFEIADAALVCQSKLH